MRKLDPAHVAWCRDIFDKLCDGGSWGVPRSGLLFRKRGNTLVLVGRMPWVEGMPMTAKELRAGQDEDMEGAVVHFGAAGINVVDEAFEPTHHTNGSLH